MSESCRHKGAAASINWFTGLLKDKTGSERKECVAAPSRMLHDMNESNCKPCSSHPHCHDLNSALKAISEHDRPPEIVSESRMIGPLTIRNEHAKKQRPLRPIWR